MGKGKYMAASRSAAVVNFIQQRFTLDDYIAMVEEENVEFLERYPTYAAIMAYQGAVLADPTVLAFAEYIVAYIENNLLQGMDKEGMTPYVIDGFYYLDGKVFLIIAEQPAEPEPTTYADLLPTPIVDVYRNDIYNFIQRHFNADDFERMEMYDYGDNPAFEQRNPDYGTFLDNQWQTVVNLDFSAFVFAQYMKSYIEHRLIEIRHRSSMVSFPASGFYYFDGQMVVFHER